MPIKAKKARDLFWVAWIAVTPWSAAACGGNETGVTSSPAGVSPPGTGGSAGAAGSGSGAGGGVAPGGCQVEFTFTIVSNGGRYAPRNVSAVWVTDAQNAFVRTVEENGFIRQRDLTNWIKSSGGNLVDAVTGATNYSPGTHDAKWDCTDVSHAPAAPGNYTMNAEFTTDNTGGFFSTGPTPFLSVPFQLGAGPSTVNPPDAQYFTGLSLTVQ